MSAQHLNADLHCHSSRSDGSLTPTQLAYRAAERGVQLWSLTDHDELSGLAEAARAAAQVDLSFVAGVEISVTWMGQTIHIVGLDVDPAHALLEQALSDMREGRAKRAIEMGDRLQALGFDGCYEGALRHADNPQLISRTHFARHMVQAGHCRTMQEVFDRYLGDGKRGYVPTQWAPLSDAVSWIRNAGGVAVIAHAGRYRFTEQQFDALYSTFRDVGGEGIEVVTGSHRPDQYAQYAGIARYYGFKASRGSDFHSPDESRIDLGALPQLSADLEPVWSSWV